MSISGSAKMFNSADNNYKEIYGKNNILKGFQINLNLSKNIYIWSSYSFGTFTGETFNLKESTKCTRSFINFGGGVKYKILKPLEIFVEGGGVYADFKEESFGATYKGTKMGFILNGGIRIRIIKALFIVLKGGYIIADTSINDVEVKLGGMIISGGLGLSF